MQSAMRYYATMRLPYSRHEKSALLTSERRRKRLLREMHARLYTRYEAIREVSKIKGGSGARVALGVVYCWKIDARECVLVKYRNVRRNRVGI